MTQPLTPETRVQAIGRVVRDAVKQLADELRGLDAAGWDAPSACAGWTVKDVAAHMAESNDRFLQVVRAAVAGEPVPDFSASERAERREAVKARPGREVADQLEQRVDAVFDLLESASPEILARTVTVPAGQLSLAQVAPQRLTEVALHSWDIHWARDRAATLNPDAVPLLLDSVLSSAPRLAKREAIQGRNATYHLLLSGPGGGSAVLELREGTVRATRGEPTQADVTLRLPAEAAIRLLWGRLDLERALADGTLQVEGATPNTASAARGAAQALDQVFRGV